MKSILITAAVAAALLSATDVANAQERIELGRLECLIEGGTGFIVGSSKDLSCTFVPADPARPAEAYFGVVNKFGVDIGVTGAAVMQWLVLGPTTDMQAPGALAGDYIGASAELTAAIGAGANLLVGGTGDTIVLQPVSVQAQTGLNVALGVTEFQLRSAVD